MPLTPGHVGDLQQSARQLPGWWHLYDFTPGYRCAECARRQETLSAVADSSHKSVADSSHKSGETA